MSNGIRRFRMDRLEDESGISGTGCVAQGVVFGDGTVVLRWLTAHRSTAIYSSLEECEAIHGHGGRTVFRFEDPICFFCGAVLDAGIGEIAARRCYGCGAGQGKALWFGARPEVQP